MSYYKNIHDRIKNLKTLKLNNVFEKYIPNEILKTLHSIVNDFLIKKKFILKGGRALNQTIKIYNDDEIDYVDYDLYAINPRQELLEIANILVEKGIREVSVENIIFKPHIYRLYIYSIPFIDVEPISEDLWDYLPTFEKNEQKIIDVNFQKLDMYVQVARPTLLNVSNWQKVIHRLIALNKVKKFEKIGIPEKGKKIDILSNYMELIGKDAIITGQIAYYLYMNKHKDVFIPNVNRIELFTHRVDKYIEIFKNKLEGKIRVEKFEGFMELQSNYNVIFRDDEPIIFIYYLDDCISYYEERSLRFSSFHHLMFYLQLLYYLPISKKYNYQSNLSHMIHDLNRYPKNIEINCFGFRNPGVLSLRSSFINKEVLFKWRPPSRIISST